MPAKILILNSVWQSSFNMVLIKFYLPVEMVTKVILPTFTLPTLSFIEFIMIGDLKVKYVGVCVTNSRRQSNIFTRL